MRTDLPLGVEEEDEREDIIGIVGGIGMGGEELSFMFLLLWWWL